MRKIIGLCTILVALLFTGCVTPSSVDAGEEAVLVKKPYFFGHGGVDPESIKTGLVWTAFSTEVVRINVKPFTAGFDEAIKLYGVATQSIIDDSDGIITIAGKVRGLDTTGASVGEVWVDNDILYAKPNDNGMMTKIVPADNELKIVVASVIKAHNVNGTLEIRFIPFNENAYYTKVQNDILLDSKVPLNDGFTLDLGEL